ncbi:MAG: LamG-like jellyroll fold domain-containing protein [Planctomycetia bacterium]|nr:LamG-like jellyroll fold domain-containing protein [Planctomycetia bacterium]
MNNSFDSSDRIDYLCDRYLQNDMSEEEAKEFLNFAAKDEFLWDRLRGEYITDALLRDIGDTADEIPFIEGRTGARTTKRKKIFHFFNSVLRFSGTAAAVLLITSAIVFLGSRLVERNISEKYIAESALPYAEKENSAAPETTSNALATILKMDQVVWKEGSPLYRTGDIITAGWLRFHSGSLLIEFFSGATVQVNGPADFMVVSQNLAYCASGKVFAHVPPQAVGFTVDVPQMKIIDKGTEFSLNVQAKKTEVQVLKGKVLLDHSSSVIEPLLAGESVLATNDGNIHRIKSISSPPESNLFQTDLSEEQIKRLRNSWDHKMKKIEEDPALLLLFDMEQIDGKTEINRSKNNSSAANGTIVGCQKGIGSFPGKTGLEFRRISDRIRFCVPDDLESCTLFARIRIDGLDRKNNNILMSDGCRSRGIVWSISRLEENKAFIRFDVRDKSSERFFHYHSIPCLDLNDIGHWISLAVVIDAKAGRIYHYLNGKKISEALLEHKFPVQINYAELGNGRTSQVKSQYVLRNFCGAMDQFAIFNRSLNSGEIGEL